MLGVLGGGLGASETIEAVTGEELDRGSGREVPLRSNMHGFTAGIGWRWVPREHLAIRIGLAYFQVLASETRIDTDSSRAAMVSRALDVYVEDLLTTWVRTPLVALHLGYRF